MKEDELLMYIEKELHLSEYAKKAINGKFKNPSSNALSISGVVKRNLINDPMKFIRLQVKTILQSYPATSDCNASLCRLYYKINHGIEHETEVGKFFDKIVNKEIPSIETICRFSRELQEKHIELRGVKWNERQIRTEKVKKDLGYNLKNK